MVTVSQQCSVGVYANVVEVPMRVLKLVDNGINLPPISKTQIDPRTNSTTVEVKPIKK